MYKIKAVKGMKMLISGYGDENKETDATIWEMEGD